ncbi:MAG: hypothetical protein HF300_17140 [Ignavibacteria bacterium]|jgi:hypothetical protein|nr:hypothetical protein [Ignavibacteria bacterium]MCU7501281.1 hypothetical protein [Ignavibacteria bacterium]MCU7514287.1 hypothetical protein [Ignavibacteria bacterium]MCU7520816.1 hypothetical protein [Ignavibacteria bacterium]MCU7526656.1 hypothetical protein [Ignavibacteria bacterium]
MEEIKRLEESALRLEPGFEEREKLLKKVTDYSEEFLKNVYSLPAYNFNAGKGEGIYDFPIQDAPLDFSKVLDILKTNVDTPGLNPASRGHLGYIPGDSIDAAYGGFFNLCQSGKKALNGIETSCKVFP